MTDAFAPSQFEAPAGAAPSTFDVTAVDRNLRQISAVESSWRLPAMPDAVKLDLASMPEASEDSLLDLLTGLDSDLNDEDEPEPSQLYVPSRDPIDITGGSQAQIILAGISNNPPPEAITSDAVKLFKKKAIEGGYLDMQEKRVDSRWSPELNRIRGEMAWDEYNKSLRGNRIGAVPIGNDEHGMMKLLNDFTSPAGLLSAATELDLFWDIGAIGDEISSWGDKWRAVADSDSPFDLVGNLFDALTGPIDDIVFPILNVGLMFTGIGAIANSARVGWQGARLANATGLFGRLYNSGSVGRAILGGSRLGANLDELGRTGLIASRLQKTEHFGGLGRGMEAWRRFTPVRATKSVMQQGMRMGFAEEVESRFGSYQGGTGELGAALGLEGAAGFLEEMKYAPVAAPFEVLLAPYNIFTPGSFIGRAAPLAKAGRGAIGALGTTGGRAAAGALVGIGAGTVAGEDVGDIAKGAAIGAAGGAALPVIGRGLSKAPVASAVKGAIVGGAAGAFLGEDPEDIALGALAGAGLFAVTDTVRAKMFDQLGLPGWNKAIRGLGSAMVKTSFVPLVEDQQLTLLWDRGMRHRLRNDPQALADWTDDVQRNGVLPALQKIQGGDRELAASTIGFVYTSAAIDSIATSQAGTIGTKGWRQRYHSARNKLTNQLRSYDTTDLTDATLDDIATSMAWTSESLPAAVLQKKAKLLREMRNDPERALEFANQQNKMAAETVKQLMNPANFPKVDDLPLERLQTADQVAVSLGEKFTRTDLEGRGWLMVKYMDQVGDTLGRFGEFTSATDGIRKATLSGLFDGAKFKPFKGRSGQLQSVFRSKGSGDPETAAINAAVTDHLMKVDKSKIGNINISPLASPNGNGRFTVALRDTMSKQQLEELAERIRDVRDVEDHFKRLGNPKLWRKNVSQILAADEATKLTDLTKAQIKAVVDQIDTNFGSKKATEYIVNYAKRHELSLGQLDQAIVRHADELANNANLWKTHGFDELVYDEQGKALFGMDAIAARLDELNDTIPFRAAEVDADDLVRYLRETGNEAGAEEMRILSEGLDRDGYKLVHGVEFLMPEDLAHGPIFQDVTRRHLNAASFGNMFKGKLPVERRLLEDRRKRLAIADAFSKIGKDLAPDDPEVGRILRGLDDLLHDIQQPSHVQLRDYHLQTQPQRFGTRLKAAAVPIRTDDLARQGNKVRDYATNTLQLSAEEAEAVLQATHKFRSADWQEVGLYKLESQLRNTNILEWGLKTLTGSKYAEGWKGKVGGVVPAAVAGAAYGAVQTAGEDLSFEERLQALATGAATGVALGAAARVGANIADQAARALPGTGTLVDRAAHWQFGYLADHLAQWRDSLRFTLSPFFDLGRYTEGLFLAQTAAPLRHADGSRVTLPLDMTPHGLRRAYRKEGLSVKEAQDKYQAGVQEFRDFAKNRGEFDPDAADSAGRWFRQLGILGFSPTDWMSTAYINMRRADFSPEQAYEAAREMYTYGTRGRSAAEMSVNMVFFPFSFQKKAIGHMAKWMNDDLARSIIIHDALQTYQVLDERYDLDKRWKDHIPFLQQLQRLNLFAYGLSPGRFGGINSQMLESGGKLAWNMFVPVGLDIKNVEAAEEAKDVWRQLIPALNDINWMKKNAQETGHVMFSESHMVTGAEVREGYNEWHDFKRGFERDLQRKGYTLTDIFNKPWLEEAKAFYEGKRAELADKYPAWQDARTENIGEIQTLRMQRQLHLDRVTQARITGSTPSPDDAMVAQFEEIVERYKDDLQLLTGSRDLTDAPPEVFDELLRIAADFARDNPRWQSLYETFYAKELGPITVALEMAA